MRNKPDSITDTLKIDISTASSTINPSVLPTVVIPSPANNQIQVLTSLLSSRRKGIESESALDEKLVLEQISYAFEKHKKQYPTAPRTFTYDKLNTVISNSTGANSTPTTDKHDIFQEIKDIPPSGVKPKTRRSFHGTKDSHNISKSSLLREIVSKSAVTSDSIIKKDKEKSETDSIKSQPAILVQSDSGHLPLQGDREVSTSYTESLDIMIRQQKELKESQAYQELIEKRKRLSQLQEDYSSRPQSTVQSTQQGSGSLNYFDDFIQYTSQDILYEPRKKSVKVIGRYVLGDVLGEGSYGKVKEGFCTDTLRRVAVKIMKQSKLKKIPSGEANVKREISILKRLRHENIVQLMDVIYKTEKQKIYVVFEYCATSMSEIIGRAQERKLPLSQSQRYFSQMAVGLGFLHSNFIVHRDIKPGNLLITIDDTVKISDFGVSESLDRFSGNDILITSQGSPAFQPPEVAAGSPKFSGIMVDIWAAGVTLYHMISGKYPFDGESIYQLFENIAKGEFKMPDEAEGSLEDLISNILQKDPLKRYRLEEILEHNWLKLEYSKSPFEVSVIPTETESTSGLQQGQKDIVVLNEAEPIDFPSMVGSISHISNPRFAYDTTLIPYLENMFEDLPNNLRRSSVVEQIFYERTKMKSRTNTGRLKELKPIIAQKFLNRISREVSDYRLKVDVEKSRPNSASSNGQRSTRSKNSATISFKKDCKQQ